ncbi:hypothetical protein Hanom_Chr15g01357471 [Helianthus anomalus]
MVIVCVALVSCKVVFWKPFDGILTLVCDSPFYSSHCLAAHLSHRRERERTTADGGI